MERDYQAIAKRYGWQLDDPTAPLAFIIPGDPEASAYAEAGDWQALCYEMGYVTEAETVREEWGMCCPSCGDDSHLMVTVLASAMLSTGGTEVYGDHEWTDESACECTNCQWRGTVADAKAAAEREVRA